MDGGRVLEGILLDLEGAGYSWEVYSIPACGVGAPHRRYRVWIVAHNNDTGCEREGSSRGWREGFENDNRVIADSGMQHGDVPVQQRGQYTSENTDVGGSSPDNAREGLEGVGVRRGVDKEGWKEPDGYGSECYRAFSHSECKGLEGRERVQEPTRSAKPDWSEHWLKVAARLCRIFNGLSRELDENINNEKRTFASGQDLPCLWHRFQQEAFRVEIRGRYTVFEPEVLFAVLWKHFRKSEGSDNLLFESEEVQGAFLRNVWEVRKPGCSPQRWEYQEQYAIEHSNALSQLSHDIALDGLESKKAFNKNRKNRLEALGNAIVPQVVYEIFMAINEYEKTSPHLHP